MLTFLGNYCRYGLVKMPKVDYYRSKSKLYGFEVIQNTMSWDKFELLIEFYQFLNNEEEHPDQDRLIKLKPLLDLFKARFTSISIPGWIVTIDEKMVPWRDRCLVKQYIPGKSHIYDVKVQRPKAGRMVE
jgi:hypothetical protein